MGITTTTSSSTTSTSTTSTSITTATINTTIITTTIITTTTTGSWQVVTLSGCPRTFATRHPATCEAATMKMSVRCCSIDGEAVSMLAYGCHTKKTFPEAMAICSSKNLRLCSSSEVGSSMLCGTGCGFDWHHVWTSTECEKAGRRLDTQERFLA